MAKFQEDPNYFYEYYLREIGGDEYRIKKFEFEAIRQALIDKESGDVIDLDWLLIKKSSISKVFYLRNQR